MIQPSAILEATGLDKNYGATVALDSVSFALHPGEVCGLLGENGAGKSTLVKILSGVVAADAGDIRIDGAVYRPQSIMGARAHGLTTAFQELSLIPTLSVAANLFLPNPPANSFGIVVSDTLEKHARQVLLDYEVRDLDPAELISNLPLGMRQRIEIIRAMQWRPRVLLLDEPTAALSDHEWLFSLIKRFVAAGSSVLYISHKIDEIRLLCQRCFILRNGEKVLDARLDEMSDADIFSSMAGRSMVGAYPEARAPLANDAEATLSVSNLRGAGIRGATFTLRRGEILGVAALEGQGQSSLLRLLSGLAAPQAGTIAIKGRAMAIRSPRAARLAGMVLVPEERKTEGIFNDLSTAANITLPIVDALAWNGWLGSRNEIRKAGEFAQRVDLGERYLRLNIDALSGGNQQKAVLARALISHPDCLLLFDPTRGVDVGTKQTIYRLLRDYVHGGGSVLFHSTELDELVHLCDRCLVMYGHEIVADVAKEDLSQQHLLGLAVGYRRPPQVSSTAADQHRADPEAPA